MDIKDIQELIKFVAKSGATEVDLEIDNVKISIKSPAMKAGKVIEPAVAIVPEMPVGSTVMTASPQMTPMADAADAKEETKSDNEATEDTSNYITIKSPMIGTFYRKPSPDKDNFVEIGDQISEGQTLCVIEAMKLFNEIESELAGTIVKILVDDASPVEFDQPLFLIKPH